MPVLRWSAPLGRTDQCFDGISHIGTEDGAVPMLTVQEFPSALSVRTTLAARPLSARSLLRTLRLALRDGGGRAGTGSGTPSITLAFAPASRCASISLMSSIPRSICSVLIALTPPECSNFISGLRFPHLLGGLASVQAEVIGQRADEVGTERSTRPFQGPASIARLAHRCPLTANLGVKGVTNRPNRES